VRLPAEYERNVFINCPFDAGYAAIFEAIVFAVIVCGFRALCARTKLDSSEFRLNKIMDLIAASKYSIHDLSRVELDEGSALPRFNMPLELGLDLGCKRFSPARKNKSSLIFDAQPFRFHKFISDIGGQDVANHTNDPALAIANVRNWLRAESGRSDLPGAYSLNDRYAVFRSEVGGVCSRIALKPDELTFVDYCQAVAAWLEDEKMLVDARTKDPA
jgi:hypothetical protein